MNRKGRWTLPLLHVDLESDGGFTESELLEQLESDGYTPVEAQYAVDKAY